MAAMTQNLTVKPNLAFDGHPPTHTTPAFGTRLIISGSDTQRCPDGLVGVGINGRSGVWLDAVGLICGPPTKTLGRVEGVPPTPSSARSICDLAREARARNSPTAPALEARCRAAGAAGETPVQALGRVKGVPPTPSSARSICDRAREARARNSPTAPALEARCRAAGAAGETPPQAALTIT